MAGRPVPQQYRKAYQDLTGGLMSRPNALQIPANKFTVLQNAILNDSDVLQKVQGYTLDGAAFPNDPRCFIRFLINYKIGTATSTLVCAASDPVNNSNATYNVDLKQSYGDGNYNYIGHTTGTALFTHSSAAVVGTGTDWTLHLKAGDKIGTGSQPSVWYEIQSVNSDTSITLTGTYSATTTTSVAYMARIILSPNTIPVGVVFNNNLVIANGSENPMETNNTSLGKLQSTNWQPVSLLEVHKNRIFGANWPASPSGLLWTYANDETTVDSTSKATVSANDNGQVVAIKSFANSLMVLKDNGNIYQVIGEFDQNAQGQPAMIRKIDCPDNVGVISGKSVVILEDNSGTQGYLRLGSKLYFLSETGIYSVNSYMQVQKVSWDIQPTLSNLLLKSTATATKQYGFTSKSQWDAGTINSLSDTRLLNGMSTFFDNQSITGAYQGNGALSTFLASNNDVHTAYIASDKQSIRYNHWLATDNTNVDTQVINIGVDSIFTTTYTNAFGIDAVAISVAANGNIGIISKTQLGDVGIPSALYIFSEFTSGVWTHTEIADLEAGGQYRSYAVGLAVVYDGSSNPSVLMGQANGNPGNGYNVEFLVRTSGVWGSRNDFGNGAYYLACAFVVDVSANIHVALAPDGSANIEYWKSTDGGATWTNPKNITVTGSSVAMGSGSINIVLNSKNDPVLIFNYTSGSGGNVGKTLRYNITTNTQTIIDSSSNNLLGYSTNAGLTEFAYEANSSGLEKFIFQTAYQGGTAILTNGSTAVTGTGTKWTTWVSAGDQIKVLSDEESDYATVQTVNSDNSITLTGNYAGTTQVSAAAYIARRTTTVTNSGSPVLTPTYYTGTSGLSNQANVVACATFGASAGQILLRRVSLYGQWYSSVLSDATLTAWGTYVVTNPTTNGNTIQYEVGLNTSSSMPDNLFSLITPGSIISTNAANIDVRARVSFFFSAFASASIQSLVMNYVGAGADAKLPFGYVFNNEMYLSVTTPSGSGNNEMVFLDRMSSWGLFTQGSCAMTRYNQQLYIGDPTSGNIYKFRQGYNNNGTAYSLIAITKEDLLGSIELQKEIYKVYVIYETQNSGTFKFSYRLDNFLNPNSSSVTGWVDSTVDQTQGTVYEVTGMGGQKCSSIQFKVQQDDANVQVGIVGFIVLYDYYNLR